jgi:probable HAF family extracellular repeat protein
MKSTLLFILLGLPAILAAQTQNSKPPSYTVTDLGTLGGDFSTSYGISPGGHVGGASNLVANGPAKAFIWYGGRFADLGTLGGPNSAANGPNARGDAAIVSETSETDPNGEDVCRHGTHRICLGALWNGVLTPLPTLGGKNAQAFALNNRDQIVGLAENTRKEPAGLCATASQVFDFEAVLWGPNGKTQELPPLKGDTVGFALGINDLGQAVGSSGTCANTGFAPFGLAFGPHAVLWESDGSVRDLGNLGGKTMGKAGAINNRGEVAGFSDVPGGAIHSFLWTKHTGMHDLGALGTDVVGDPAGINNQSQVVGGSCDSSGACRAFFWQDNHMMDLNQLVTGSPLYLFYGLGINDAGEIVGLGVNSFGEFHSFLATPKYDSEGESAELATQGVNGPVVLPENTRKLLQQRMRLGRIGGGPIIPR